MTPEQTWQIIAGLLTLVIALVVYIWLRQHHWIRDHEARLKVIENDHLKRSEFDGAMNALRTQMAQNTKQLTELETETRVRMEYVGAQLSRLEDGQVRIEGLLTGGKSQRRKQ